MTQIEQLGPEIGERGSAPAAPPGAVVQARNEVRLVGRLSAQPEVRRLPSGDELVNLRLVVARDPLEVVPVGSAQRRRPTVDTLDCTAWSAATRATAVGLAPGDVLEVTGALRRRFYRAGAATLSRYDVEVAHVRRLAAPEDDGATAGRAATGDGVDGC